MRVEILYPEKWLAHQPELRPLIDEALKYAQGDWAFEDIDALVRSGQVMAFACFDGPLPASVLLGQYVFYPRKTVFLVTLASGGFKAYGAALEQVFTVVKAGGATCVEAWCRPSVSRLLRTFKFYKAFEVVRYDL